MAEGEFLDTVKKELRNQFVKQVSKDIMSSNYVDWAVEAHDNKDYSKAYYYANEACKLGRPLGCVLVGEHHELGLGTFQSYEKAGQLYKKACDMPPYGNDAAAGCLSLARLYYSPGTNRTAKSTAERYYRKACDYNLKPACDILRKYY